MLGRLYIHTSVEEEVTQQQTLAEGHIQVGLISLTAKQITPVEQAKG